MEVEDGFTDASSSSDAEPSEGEAFYTAPTSPKSRTTIAYEAQHAIAKAKLEAARERSRRQLAAAEDAKEADDTDAGTEAAAEDGGAEEAADDAEDGGAEDGGADDAAAEAADAAADAADVPDALDAANEGGDGEDAEEPPPPVVEKRARFFLDGDGAAAANNESMMLLEQLTDLPGDLDASHRGRSYREESARLVDSPTARRRRKSLAKTVKNGIRHSTNLARESILGKKKAVCARHFKPKLILGAGAFGTVLLVKKRTGYSRGKLYAMKVMDKADTSKKIAKAERDVLVRLCHIKSPFLVSIRYAMQSATRVFMVMQFVDGCSLEDQQRVIFALDDTQRDGAVLFVAAALTLGLVHLHLAGIIHHDVKPANILMRHDGHLFICDFGLATLCETYKSDKRRPRHLEDKAVVEVKKGFQGTVAYTAPEVLQKSKHVSSAVDWWSLGVLLYELVHDGTPFAGASVRELFANILFKAPVYGDGVPARLSTFLGKLLTKDPRARHGIATVQVDPYFHAVSWPDMKKRKIEPPFVPDCESVTEDDFCDALASDDLMRRWYDDAPTDGRSYDLMDFNFSMCSEALLQSPRAAADDDGDSPPPTLRGSSVTTADDEDFDKYDALGRITSPSQKTIAKTIVSQASNSDDDRRSTSTATTRARRSSSGAFGYGGWFSCFSRPSETYDPSRQFAPPSTQASAASDPGPATGPDGPRSGSAASAP